MDKKPKAKRKKLAATATKVLVYNIKRTSLESTKKIFFYKLKFLDYLIEFCRKETPC